MSDPLYRKPLLRLAADAHGAGHLSEPHLSGSAFNPTCGDRVTVEIVLDGAGRIGALAHDTRACVLAQASAAILGRNASACTHQDVHGLREAVAAMLKGEAPPPSAPFDLYREFKGAADHAARHTCVLLPLDALLDAFAASEAGKADAEST
jgi:nitrogen fixation NifU-like protein